MRSPEQGRVVQFAKRMTGIEATQWYQETGSKIFDAGLEPRTSNVFGVVQVLAPSMTRVIIDTFNKYSFIDKVVYSDKKSFDIMLTVAFFADMGVDIGVMASAISGHAEVGAVAKVIYNTGVNVLVGLHNDAPQKAS